MSQRECNLAVCMVGLPARGKTYTARKLARYLNWLGVECKVFNVGNHRRRLFGDSVPHEFFDPRNPTGLANRRKAALAALDELQAWCALSPKRVAIYDATNSTRERRELIKTSLAAYEVMFVELVCEDVDIVEANIGQHKVSSPDYANMEQDAAIADFKARIAHYLSSYEHLGYDEGSFVRVFNAGERLEMNQVRSYLPSRIVTFLMNLHVVPRKIYFTRHGQSMFNTQGRIGGDSPLSERGHAYSLELRNHLVDEGVLCDSLHVWTSQLQRTIQTAAPLGTETVSWPELNEIDGGDYDGLTYAQIEARDPVGFAERKKDKLRYRYPMGESYQDLIRRVEPVIMEIERIDTNVLIVCHQAVLRALYAYFVDIKPEKVPHLSVPLHTLFELTPHAYGCDVRTVVLEPDRSRTDSTTSL